MIEQYLTAMYLIIFIPMIYIIYNLLKAFDFQKILRKGQIGQLKVLMIVISVGLSYLFASAIVEVIERLSKFFV